jgi:Xaa-Pro aminopeptidase
MRLSVEGCQQRRARLMAQTQAEWIIISNPRHLLYLCGLYCTPLELSSWGTNFLVINTRSGHTTLIAHSFIQSAAMTAYYDDLVLWRSYDASHTPTADWFQGAVNQLNLFTQNYGIQQAACEYGWLPHGVLVQPVLDVNPILERMQRQKDADELALIRRNVQVVEAGHLAARQTIRPGATELDVYNAICTAMTHAAGMPILPLGDFVSGERAFRIGGPPTDRVLKAGEVMIVDLFPVVAGYRADFTATIAVGDQPSDAQRRLDDALHAALAAGETLLRPGSSTSAIYAAVKSTLDAQGYDGNFPHHAGHGLGLGHPQAPYLVADSTETLLEDDVITLEPGAYGPDFGARIEHNYRITAGGYERLSNHRTTLV